MIRKTFIFLILFILILYANGLKKWTLEDAVIHGEKFFGKSLTKIEFIPGTNYFSHLDIKNGFIIIRNIKNGKEKSRISLKELKHIMIDKVDTSKFVLPLEMEWIDKNKFQFWYNDSLFTLNIAKKKVSLSWVIPTKYQHKFVSPNKQYMVLVKDYNLYLLNRKGELKQLTRDGNENIQYGTDVHRREFGIKKGEGVFWSPDGKKFAFYRKDQTMVKDYPYFQYHTRPMSIKFQKYPMAGLENHLVQLGIYNLAKDTIIYLNTGPEKDVYLTSIAWTGDGKHLLLARVNRDQNHVDVMRFTGVDHWKSHILFTENDARWTEPENSIIPLKQNPKQFLWYFYRGGFKNLTLYNIYGRKIKEITQFHFDITQIYGEKNGKIFMQATGKDPLDRHVFVADTKDKKVTQITSGQGNYSLLFNPNGPWQLISFSDLKTPYRLYNVKNQKLGNIIYTSPNPLKGYAIPKREYVTIKANDGCDLYGLLITPPEMQPEQKYPVLVYVYGGPHSQLVRHQWLGFPHPWLYYMAQNGYVVFVMDNHGTDNRGKHFAQENFRRLGTVELNDQLKGIEYVRSLSFVDTERIGVHGWSFGGFMTLTLMTRASDIYKVGIAGAPVVDWKYYETVYTERYMDTPENNPEGYQQSSILNHIQNLKGKLLVIHGTSDETVVWQHTILLLEKAIQTGRQIDYFIFPGQKHGIRGKGRFYLYKKMTDYFNQFLK